MAHVEEPPAPVDQTRLVRRLRIALVAVAMLVGISLIAVLGALFYWNAYLLGGADGSPFARGPYVVSVEAESALVRFSGPSPDDVLLTAVAPDGSSITARDGRFTGLESGQRYVWTASVDGRGGASGSFQTPPMTLDEPITFGVVADYGSGKEPQYAVGRGLAAVDPAFVLTAGDNSYLLALERLLDRNIFLPFAEVLREAPLIVGLGDHDTFGNGAQPLIDAFDLPGDGLRYVYEYGPVQVLVLGIEGDADALRFAKEQLAKPWDGPRFAVIHTPIQPGNPINEVLRGEVQAVFSGHLHRCERRVVDGVLVVVAGCGGQGPGDEAFTLESKDAEFSTMDFGFVRVRAGAESTEIVMIDETGVVRDRVTVPNR